MSLDDTSLHRAPCPFGSPPAMALARNGSASSSTSRTLERDLNAVVEDLEDQHALRAARFRSINDNDDDAMEVAQQDDEALDYAVCFLVVLLLLCYSSLQFSDLFLF